MATEELLNRTAAALPHFEAKKLHPIEKGGSSRRFFRILSGEGDSVILVQDLGEKEENRHYASLAGFLDARGVPVPAVLAEEPVAGLLWLQDLGETDLWSFRNEPWTVRRPFYESALSEISRLHRIPVEEAADQGLRLQREFDESLYRWEQEYFSEHCLGGLFGIPKTHREALLEAPSMRRLSGGLAGLPRQLIHRDFQSQNILVRGGGAWFIDFQGMRPGVAQYDLASLLCDPYVTIPASERDHLLAHYHREQKAAGMSPEADFIQVFWQCAAQRLMQALGAYGFLSLHRGKTAFRSHVAPALANLHEALSQLDAEDRLDELADLIKDLPIPQP